MWHQWGNHRMHADAVWTGGVRYRAGIIQSAPKLRAQLDGVFSNYLRRAKRHTQYCFSHAVAAVRPTRPSQVTARSVTCGSDATSFNRPKNTVLGTAPGSSARVITAAIPHHRSLQEAPETGRMACSTRSASKLTALRLPLVTDLMPRPSSTSPHRLTLGLTGPNTVQSNSPAPHQYPRGLSHVERHVVPRRRYGGASQPHESSLDRCDLALASPITDNSAAITCMPLRRSGTVSMSPP